MMQGNYLKGLDIHRIPVEGVILDTVICAQVVNFKRPGVIGGSDLPMPLTAYLIHNEDTGTLHLVPPDGIHTIMVPVPEPIMKAGMSGTDYDNENTAL